MENITKALVKFHMEVGKIKKDAKNPFFNSSYASLSNILDVVTPPLVTCGLAIIQMPIGDGLLKTILAHDSGEYIESEFDMKIVKRDPQSMGSAITYARRYALGAILCLNIDEDDDANTATPSSQERVDEKPWFNATNKDGALNKAGKSACDALLSNKRTWKDLESKYKVSKKDKEAMVAYIEDKIMSVTENDAS